MKHDFDKTRAQHQAGMLAEAKAGYLALLQENPQDSQSLHYLALVYAEEGDWPNAEASLQKAIAISPGDLFLQLHLANIYKAQGRKVEAEKILLQVIQQNPDFAAAHNNLGTLYFSQGKWQEAIQLYRKAIDAQADYADAYYNLGLALNKFQHREEAMTVFQALLELTPGHLGALFQAALIYMERQHYQAAIDNLTQIAQDYPFHYETQVNLATSYLRLGWLPEAKTHYLKAIDIQPDDTQILFNLGVIAMQRGAVNEAIEYYERALQINPDYFDAHNNLAVVLLGVRKRALALKHFKEALRIQPQDEAIKHTVGILSQDKNLLTSPPDYIRSLFNAYADHYDAHLEQALDYQVPQRMQVMVAAHLNLSKAQWDILDIGCGTGLCASVFKPAARQLTGVDLAEQMLAQAKAKNIYDRLIQSDILSFLQKQSAAWDLIVAGDVLVYFGDLQAVLQAAWQALKPQGLFVFDVEQGREAYALQETGRFAHAKKYLDQLIQQTGFTTLAYEDIPLRLHLETTVRGHLYLLQKGKWL